MGCGLCFLFATHSFAVPAVILAWDANPEADISSYRLSYGTTTGSYSNVIDVGTNLEASVPNLVQGNVYYFAVSAVNTSGVQSHYSSEFPYYVESELTSPNGWSLTYADSEDFLGYRAALAFDGDPNTFWHTTWRDTAAPPPHEIQINLGTSQVINGFRYLPRQDEWLSGSVGQFEFYVSSDGVAWGNPVATGAFPCNHDLKEIRFAATSGQYIRFRGLTDANGGPYMSVAEIGLIQDSIPVVTNQPPVSLPASSSVAEDSFLNLVLQGTDPDGNALHYSVVSAPAKGTLSGTPPNLTYTPTANYNGTDSFTFLVGDGALNSAPATVSIVVTAINDAPVALTKSVSTAEDSPMAVTLVGTDIDANPLTLTILSSPAHGTLAGTAPNLIYQPAANFSGSDSFTFKVNDGAADSPPATVWITVTPVNDAPLATSKSVTLDEDSLLPIVLTGTDSETASLSFSVLAAPSHGTLVGAAPNFTYSPAANFSGADQFTFRANDGTVDSVPSTIVITVNAVNDAPVALSTSATTEQDSPLPITLTGTDLDGNPLSYTVIGSPANGTLSGSAPNLTYQPTVGFIGHDELSFKVNDGTLHSALATVSITVSEKPATLVANRLSRAGWTLKYVDSEQTPKSPGTAAFDGNPTTFWQTRNQASSAALPHEIQINLGAIQNISGFQCLPRQDQSTVGNIGSYEFYVSLDGIAWGSPVAIGSFTSSAVEKLVYFTAKSGQFVRFRALTEVQGGSATCVAELNILKEISTNQLPVASPQTLTTQMATSLPLVLSGSDPEGSPLAHSIVSGPLSGTLSGTAPNLTYLPNADFVGNDQFTFQSNDGTNTSVAATVSISVTPVIDVSENTAPVFTASPIVLTTSEDVPVAGQLLATDADEGDVLSFQKTSGPAWLTVSIDGQLAGTPISTDVGTGTFTVNVSDPSLATSTATLSITVSNSNDAPVFKLNPMVSPSGTEKAIYVGGTLATSATDSDAGDTIEFSKVSGPAWLVVAKSGVLGGTPPSGSAGTNVFTIRATDMAGAFAEASLQIKINANTLPLPWDLDRVGNGNLAGAATYSSSAFTLAGAGVIASTEDSGSFGWQTLSGAGSITARLNVLSNTETSARIGVTIRESLAANSRQLFIGVDGTRKFQWIRRHTTAGSTAKTSRKSKTAAASAAIWVRLVRKSNVFTAYQSTNGTTWTKIGSSTVTLPKNCYIGLWVGSGDKGFLSSSKFTNVVVTP